MSAQEVPCCCITAKGPVFCVLMNNAADIKQSLWEGCNHFASSHYHVPEHAAFYQRPQGERLTGDGGCGLLQLFMSFHTFPPLLAPV